MYQMSMMQPAHSRLLSEALTPPLQQQQQTSRALARWSLIFVMVMMLRPRLY